MSSSSYIANPKDNTTLILSYAWLPINITNTREAMKKLMANGSHAKKEPTVKVLSGSGEPMVWDDWIDAGKATYYSNQPFLRATSRLFPVPTIILTSAEWGYKSRSKPNIKYLYARFRGVCQICGDRLPLKQMSIEHILPKSMHGADESFNITMTCKRCNSRKSSIYPYKDLNNRDLKAPTDLPFFHTFLNERPEWKPFLLKK